MADGGVRVHVRITCGSIFSLASNKRIKEVRKEKQKYIVKPCTPDATFTHCNGFLFFFKTSVVNTKSSFVT